MREEGQLLSLYRKFWGGDAAVHTLTTVMVVGGEGRVWGVLFWEAILWRICGLTRMVW